VTGSRRLEVLGGTGTVCRVGTVVAWFGPGFSLEMATGMLESANAAAPSEGAHGLAQALQGEIGHASSPSAPAFAIAVEFEAVVAVVLQGHVVASEDGVERLRGSVSDALASADFVTGASLTIRGGGDPDQLDRPGSLPFDLREGTVPGGGVTFWPSERVPPLEAPALDDQVVLFDLSVPATARQPLPVALPPASVAPPSEPATPAPVSVAPPSEPAASAPSAAAPPSEPPAASQEPPGSQPAPPLADTERTEVGDPAPAASRPSGSIGSQPAPSAPTEHSASEHRHLVRGITCARGHFNNPRALYCGICGLAMVQNSIVLVDGPRPPLGVLLSDTGMAYSLDGDYVLGREPELAADVVDGRARPIRLDDGTGKISRVHARVSLLEWDVVITDLKSHNGTSVFNPGETTWRRLRAEEAVVLQPGGRLVVGQSTFEYQSIQRQ
jgi:hypothetical protein